MSCRLRTVIHADVDDERFLSAARAGEARGAVVIVDVLRAFTTAAYAFAAGARRIWLTESVDQALAMKAARPDLLIMGEDGGRRIAGFDHSNSPAEIAGYDLSGRELVQRTSAGTRGAVAAAGARRRWCASLVCATATAAAVRDSGLGAPSYVITGWRGDERPGLDDLETARLIDRAWAGAPLGAEQTARAVATGDEAARTLALGSGHVDPRDIELAVRVDAFDFAMEAVPTAGGLVLERTPARLTSGV